MVRGKGGRKGSPNRNARHAGRQSRSEGAIAGTLASPKRGGTGRTLRVQGGTGRAETGGSSLFAGATANALLNAAKKLFAQKGYDGTSIKELSDAAGANISLVSYHFGGKEGLYRACLDQFGKTASAQVAKLLRPAKSTAEFELRLGLFIEFMVDTFIQEPELSQLAFKEADLETAFIQDVFQNSFLGIFKSIVHFFDSAQKENLLDPELDPHSVSSIFFGSLSHYARMDKIAHRYFGRTIREPKVREKVIWHLKRLYSQGLISIKK